MRKSDTRYSVLRTHGHLWPWFCWRGKSKLPNENPLEHRVLCQFHIKFRVSRSGVRAPVQAIPCFQVWGSNPRPGNVEQYGEWQHTLDTQSNHAVQEQRESTLWQPIASQSVPMGVYLAVSSFLVKIIMSRGVNHSRMTSGVAGKVYYSILFFLRWWLRPTNTTQHTLYSNDNLFQFPTDQMTSTNVQAHSITKTFPETSTLPTLQNRKPSSRCEKSPLKPAPKKCRKIRLLAETGRSQKMSENPLFSGDWSQSKNVGKSAF